MGDDAPLKLTIGSPKNGTTYTGAVEITGGIDDGPDGRFTVIIKCFGVTHHHLTPERVSLLGIKTTTGFSDALFNQTPGQHTAQISVWHQKNPKPLAEATVTFTIVKPDSIEGDRLDDIRRDITGAGRTVLSSQRTLWSDARDARRGKRTVAQLADSEDWLRKRLLNDRYTRLSALTRVAELYERALDPARALRALQLAQKLNDMESAAVAPRANEAVSEPPHLMAFVRYHTCRGDYEKTLDYWKQIIAWHEGQFQRADLDAKAKNSPRESLWRAYEAMGEVHVLFKNDLDGYATCRKKASQVRN